MVDFEQFLTLAPTEQIESRRSKRFNGAGLGVSLSDFGTKDQERIHTLYAAIQNLYLAWKAEQPQKVTELKNWPDLLAALQDPDFMREVQRLGNDSGNTPAIGNALHDIRGGALPAALGFAQLFSLGIDSSDPLRIIYYARDHAKIMRNVISDLDPEVRAADEAERAHDLKGVLDSWQDGEHWIEDKRVSVSIVAEYTGDVSSCCLEVSALGRVMYNLVNNAARFDADDEIVIITSLVRPELVRIAVANRIEAEHKTWLSEHTGDNLAKLFLGGITRGGNGIGLGNCTDIVSASFGYSERSETLNNRIIGAKIVNDVFWSYFHWPTY